MEFLSDAQLTEILLKGQFLDEKKIAQLQKLASETHKTLEQTIVDREVLTDEHLGQILAQELGIPFVDLRFQSIPYEVLTILPEEFANKNGVISFKKDEEGLHVGMHNVKDVHLIQLLEKRVGLPVVVYYATLNDIHLAINHYKRQLDDKIRDLAKAAMTTGTKESEDDTVVIEIVDLLLDFSYTSKSSDLHIEPQDTGTLIRFRVDGVLRDILVLPRELHDRIVTRLKIISHLRTDEHFAAQDGHMTYVFSGEKVDIRLSIVPTTFGEKAVMRLLSEKSRQFSLEELGLGEKDFKILDAQIKKPWGMILVTGPTGSGKTTSLYAIMKILNKREVNISTIEDPVEYSVSGLNQIQVNTKTNLTFASGLRSIVRQDPDIIMVGEIRDEETADISINAALTGHLMLSTLHTNDAATALPRLLDMNIEPFLVASTVNVVVAQRLVRHICMRCITSYSVDPDKLAEDGYVLPKEVMERIFEGGKARRLYKGTGCELCNHTGFVGRSGVFEILVVDAPIRKMILEQQSSDVIRDYAIAQGMTTMLDDSIEKVISGVTTIEEVLRVIREQ